MAGELDAAAPWQHKREAPTSMDRMRFIDVIAWSGGFDCFPSVTFANMLPNNQGVVERLGGMQTMFTNIEAAKAFNPAFAFVYDTLISPEARRVADRMPTNAVYQNVLHELGHSLGAKPQRKESEAFGGHAMTLEETRAELFSLWSAAELLKRGMIVRDDLIAMQYDMLFSLIRSMPNGLFGHSGARNIMFNNFLEHGAIHKVDGKYTVDSDVMTAAATSLLATVADMRAIGDSRAFEELKENYLRQECVEEFRELLGTANGGWSVLFREIQNPGCTSFRTPRSSRDEARSLERLLLL